ncbi:MAG: HAMP domain-containing sensor histidine kinase [Clostridia bacterium]|nr:HAMP domain-containing sensor histidine kinase [Clostridia bacterium]
MKSKTKYGSKLTTRFIVKLITLIFTYTLLLMIGWIMGRLICQSFTWSYDDFLYQLLTGIGYNLFSMAFIWLVGCIIIFYIVLRQTLGYIDSIVEASEKLIEINDEWIELPDDLADVGEKMNQVKQQSIKNIRLAKEAEQKKNDLIVYLAHDLKTPLTSVIGYLELLKEEPDLPMKQRIKYTNITLDKAYRLEELMNEFFEIARFNDINIVLMKKTLNLKLMLQQLVDEFYPVINEQNKHIIIDCDDQITCYADPDKLSRVFNNVIKNAISYSFENTDIQIVAHCENEMITVSVQNTGFTIPKDKLDSIFEKFYRLDDARNTSHGGAGLGLAIAKEIISLHGGKISATSENDKTTFTLIFPQNQKTS